MSHETIYLSLFVQSRGALRRELTRYLRTGRAMRHPRGKRLPQGQGQLRDTVHISQRPAEAGRPGGARPLGRRPAASASDPARSATLVERPSRFVMLVRAPRRPHRGARAAGADRADRRAPRAAAPLADLGPGQGDGPARRSSPSTPACRSTSAIRAAPGSAARNENTNGLLRQYFPKGADLRQLDQAELDAVAAELNGRPRQTLGFRHPHRHSPRRCDDPLRPPTILRCQRIWLGVIVLLADDRLKRLPAS